MFNHQLKELVHKEGHKNKVETINRIYEVSDSDDEVIIDNDSEDKDRDRTEDPTIDEQTFEDDTYDETIDTD